MTTRGGRFWFDVSREGPPVSRPERAFAPGFARRMVRPAAAPTIRPLLGIALRPVIAPDYRAHGRPGRKAVPFRNYLDALVSRDHKSLAGTKKTAHSIRIGAVGITSHRREGACRLRYAGSCASRLSTRCNHCP